MRINAFNDIWTIVLENIKKSYSEVFVTLWLNDFRLEVLNNTYAVLVNDSDFKCNFVKSRHLPVIKEHLEQLIGYEVKVVVLSEEKQKVDLTPYIEERTEETEEKPVEEKKPVEIFPETDDDDDDKDPDDMLFIPASEKFPSYHTMYTFDNFIVGNSNNLAYEACIAVCRPNGMLYNPLFIYGPSGLGKTHLLYAINNEMLKKNPKAKILYVSGEDFANQLIENLRKKSPISFRENFRNKFRKTDILMIDDIHFIAGKESTQEEIFHTFNALYSEGKQIILTSDRPPKEIKTLEERLRTRFEGGLIADIQPPDYELRTAIIKHKAKQMNIELDNKVVDLLAENLRSNVRQIEGAVKKIAAHSFLNGNKITLDLAIKCISDVLTGSDTSNITVDRILDTVARRYGVTVEDIKGNKRNREIAKARHICIYALRKLLDMSFPKMGSILGKDHSTIKSAFDNIDSQMKESSLLEIEVSELIKEIKGI